MVTSGCASPSVLSNSTMRLFSVGMWCSVARARRRGSRPPAARRRIYVRSGLVIRGSLSAVDSDERAGRYGVLLLRGSVAKRRELAEAITVAQLLYGVGIHYRAFREDFTQLLEVPFVIGRRVALKQHACRLVGGIS